MESWHRSRTSRPSDCAPGLACARVCGTIDARLTSSEYCSVSGTGAHPHHSYTGTGAHATHQTVRAPSFLAGLARLSDGNIESFMVAPLAAAASASWCARQSSHAPHFGRHFHICTGTGDWCDLGLGRQPPAVRCKLSTLATLPHVPNGASAAEWLGGLLCAAMGPSGQGKVRRSIPLSGRSHVAADPA